MSFTDDELVMIEEALYYWRDEKALDLSRVELSTYSSAMAKIEEALEAT